MGGNKQVALVAVLHPCEWPSPLQSFCPGENEAPIPTVSCGERGPTIHSGQFWSRNEKRQVKEKLKTLGRIFGLEKSETTNEEKREREMFRMSSVKYAETHVTAPQQRARDTRCVLKQRWLTIKWMPQPHPLQSVPETKISFFLEVKIYLPFSGCQMSIQQISCDPSVCLSLWSQYGLCRPNLNRLQDSVETSQGVTPWSSKVSKVLLRPGSNSLPHLTTS